MENWLASALAAMFFAGLTSVVAKFGLKNVSADFALAVRTAAVLAFVWLLVFAQKNIAGEWQRLDARAIGWLVASGATTALSWLFYYRAMKNGPVSIVAAIDKGSIVITVLLSFLLLREPVSFKTLAGTGLILAGLLVLVWN